jgi:preprotein translocase subunit SecF
MLRPIRLIPFGTNVPFIRFRTVFMAVSAVLVLLSVALVLTKGLNFGIDFRGGTLIEVRMDEPADIGGIRGTLGGLGLGDVSIQEFGAPTDVLIRVQRQPDLGEDQSAVIEAVRSALGPGVEYRRIEFVGPTVGDELRERGTLAVLLALAAILLYIWFRFEWQFGVGAVVALIHDVITTIGVFSLIALEFNLATVAAILTIAGYSINDTVVIYDRVRENLRRYKSMPIAALLNRSVNDTLSRTVMTSVTTLLALGALYAFGGEVIRGFAFAMIWGVVIGTYSTIFVAVPMLLWIGIRAERFSEDEAVEGPQQA